MGTVHGLPDDAPTVTGVVQRIRVLGQRFLLIERRLEPVPGTLELTDVTSSPRWFTSPIESGGERVHETDVLLDLAVPHLA